jgi:hypothetical protein
VIATLNRDTTWGRSLRQRKTDVDVESSGLPPRESEVWTTRPAKRRSVRRKPHARESRAPRVLVTICSAAEIGERHLASAIQPVCTVANRDEVAWLEKIVELAIR